MIAHALFFHALDDLVHQLILDVPVLLVAPPDQHVGPLEQFVRQPLVRVGQTGLDDLPALEVLQPLGDGAVDVVRINVLRRGAF